MVLNRRKGLNVELYNLKTDPGETIDVAMKHPKIVDEIVTMMKNAHVKNPFWDVENKPLFDADAAAKANGVEADFSNSYYKPQKK